MFKINLKVLTFIFILSFIIVVSIFYNQHKDSVLIEANKRITTILNINKALHKYIENVQKPVIYDLKKDGKLYNEFFDPKLLSFTYIARNIHNNYVNIEKSNNNTPYIYKLAATNPRNPVNQATEFEANILNKFRDGKLNTFSTMLNQHGEEYFFKAVPIDNNKQSCMKCHSTPDVAPKELVELYGPKNAFGEKVGDIRAMISLKIPISTIIKNSLNQFYINVIILFFIFIIFYIILIALIKKDEKLEKTNLMLSESIEKIKIKSKELHEKDKLLAQQSKMSALGDMIGNIAHQWRQPLGAISTAASGIHLEHELNTLNDKKMKEYTDGIVRNTKYLSETIDTFRNFIKAEKKSKEIVLQDEINQALNIISTVLRDKQIKLNNTINYKEEINITIITGELPQVIINIINNSKDILLEKNINNPYVEIGLKNIKDKAVITIEDNGGGIPDEIMPKIFEPYFTTKHQSLGTGLGLHMSYNIITESLRGKLYAKNTKSGAKFFIELPLK